MWNQRYDVTMDTPIGARYGSMMVVVDDGEISGILNILKKANAFSGTIDEEGSCEIQGKLTTLMRTISYHATGRVTKESLSLNLKGGSDLFKISGTADTPAPIKEKEQVL